MDLRSGVGCVSERPLARPAVSFVGVNDLKCLFGQKRTKSWNYQMLVGFWQLDRLTFVNDSDL